MSKKLLIIGAGGIGSNLIPILSRIGLYDITVYDPDIIEEKNITYQNFKFGEIGMKKANVMAKYDKVKGEPFAVLTKGQLKGYDLVVCCVDNLAARRLLYDYDKPWLDLRAEGRNCVLITYDTPVEMYDELLSGPDGNFSCQGADWNGKAKGINCMHYVVAGLGAQWIQRWFSKDYVDNNWVMNF